MPDYARSVDEMVADMEKAVTEPEGNTSNAKHRQHVAEAIKQLIDSQIISKKVRYIEDATGSKAASKTAPALLALAAATQEMASEISGRNMSYTITIKGPGAAAAAPRPSGTGKRRGRPPKDPVAAAAKKLAEAEQKKKVQHNTAIAEWQRVFVERKRYLDAGIGDEFPCWEADVRLLCAEQSTLDPMAEAYDEKGEEIKEQKKKMREKQKAYWAQCDTYDAQLLDHHTKIVLPDINDTFHHVPNWTGYKVPSKEWCEWMDGFEEYMLQKHPDCDYAHSEEENAWFANMNPEKDAVPTFYPYGDLDCIAAPAPAPAPATPPPPPSPPAPAPAPASVRRRRPVQAAAAAPDPAPKRRRKSNGGSK